MSGVPWRSAFLILAFSAVSSLPALAAWRLRDLAVNWRWVSKGEYGGEGGERL